MLFYQRPLATLLADKDGVSQPCIAESVRRKILDRICAHRSQFGLLRDNRNRPIMYQGHAKFRQKAAVKCAGFFKLADRQNYMRHTIDTDFRIGFSHAVVIALPSALTASARPGEGGILRPRSQAGRARI